MQARHSRGVRVLAAAFAAVLLAVFGATAGSASAGSPQATRTGEWQQAMQRLPLPGRGCFSAAFPAVKWLRAKCHAAPRIPFEPAPPPPPGGSPPPQVVAGGGPTDYSAVVSGLLTSATGSFDSEGAGVTESGPTPTATGPGASTANVYSLQLNSQTFGTKACSAAKDCVGWAQFVYDSADNDIFIQYWLEHFDAACPSGWQSFTFPGAPTDIYCFTSSSGVTLTRAAPAASDLASVTLTGQAPAGGTDAVVMTYGGAAVGTDTDPDSTVLLADHWNTAEFGVYGDGFGTEATFSSGTDLHVRVTTHNGTRTAPSCVLESFTGETNSLSLSSAPAIGIAPAPGIVSDQTTSPGTPSCATASGIGDTHLTTFRDLLYDFQAAGDFELATTGPGFSVQARQVSGAPMWPNAAVNRAVAARVGPARVAVCTAPTRLMVNGRQARLASGHQLRLPGGGAVSLRGSTYFIRRVNGDSVSAQVNSGSPSWINVSVGLHRWPEPERGLLASAGTDASAIETRGGTVLTAPFGFQQFYGSYASSWRVPAGQSLLTPCGRKARSSTPATVFYASNLPPRLAGQALAACRVAGVRTGPLLDACTVDTAVLKSKAATRAYLTEPTGVTVGHILPPQPGSATRRS
jgi:hypothetical protein